jgi:hypothetical protein
LIKDNAKKIIKYMLDQVLSNGNLNADICIRYDTLAEELKLENENHCRVCFQYLSDLHYIHIIDNNNGSRLIRLTAKGIDFLESN